MKSAQETKRIALISKDEVAKENKAKELRGIENEIKKASLSGHMRVTLNYSICEENCDILKKLGYNVSFETLENNAGYRVYIRNHTAISWENA